MDIIKDIVKKDTLYNAEEQRFFLYNKLEKITMAVYLITDIFPKSEPLKFCLRNKCLGLLSFIMSLRDNSKESEIEILSLASEVSSLLNVATSANLISEMNYKILINEYNKFLKLVKGQSEDKLILEKDFFEESFNEIPQISKGQSKGQLNINVLNKNIKDITTKKRISKRKKSGVFKKEKLERKQLILKFIKDNKEVSIKDISRVIKTCSEKTIQRDLMNMMKEGVLKKEGKKRWSKYLIKK